MTTLLDSEFWMGGLDCLVMVCLATVAMLPIMWAVWKGIDKMIPGRLWKQIVDDKNVAVAIAAGSMFLGVSIVLGSIVHKLL